ncbi:MAG: transketolase [Syntrophales bacterium]|nr:transketolase [Syntrophales bacterium]MDD5642958.1 transketolase [Syntrophales bacterium]
MSEQEKIGRLKKLATLIRYYILACTTEAGSGHPTSSLSATELMTALFFAGFFRYDPGQPEHPNNDRLIFSKGHASPLFYALWTAAGRLPEEELIKTYRKFGSPLEGHPTVSFPYTEAATGSLGQGLSIGLGMALNAKYLDRLPYLTFVLLGDSEMAEGSQWEAIQLAAHYELDNLIAILDVNRLGQRGETMYGRDCQAYEQRVSSFGWETILVDGHSFEEILPAYQQAALVSGKPVMIIAKTIKGKGVSFVEDKNGWHGKALKPEEFNRALKELEPIDKSVRGTITKPHDQKPLEPAPQKAKPVSYPPDQPVATRKAYGNALARIGPEFPRIVSLDGEVSNSTMAEIFQEAFPGRFFEMYIAEQNMVGMGLGLARRGKIPFVSTFAAFFSRAYDQIRMSTYSDPNLKFVGSHAGVSIGEDGPSQMGLEDLAMFRAVLDSVVLYPCDAVSTEKLVEAMAGHRGVAYLRTTRMATPILYGPQEEFMIGGSKVLKESGNDAATVIAAGVTVFEALKAYEALQKEGVNLRVIDLYSIKPVDLAALQIAARETKALITVEDHYPEGGLGEAVSSALAATRTPVHSLAVRRKPKSGKPGELLDYEGISAGAIIRKVKELS